MTKNRNSKPCDLEDRTLKFAKNVRTFVKKLPKTIGNIEDGKPLKYVTIFKNLCTSYPPQ